MKRVIGAVVVVGLAVVLVVLPRIGRLNAGPSSPVSSVGDVQVEPVSYAPDDPYLAYFSGHWCNCWRKIDLPVFEQYKSFEGVLPRGRTPAWGKHKVIHMAGVTPEEELLARAFCGAINRRIPMWYLIEGQDFWMQGTRKPWQDGITGKPLMGIWGPNAGPLAQQLGYQIKQDTLLMGIKRFVNELSPPPVKAIVLYDPTLLDPNAKPAQPRAVLNVIRTLCGTEQALPMTPQLYQRFMQQAWQGGGGLQDRVPTLPVLDTRQMEDWSLAKYNGDEQQATMAVYTWAMNNLWDKCLKVGLVFVPPLGSEGEGDVFDYVNQFGLFTFYIDGNTNLDERTLEMVLSKTPQNCPIIGVIGTKNDPQREEKRTRLIRLFSRFGKFFIDCQGARNISFHSGERPVEREVLQQKPPADMTVDPAKKYIAFCLTTGNSLGHLLNVRPIHWDYQSRGSVPLGWAVPLAAADAYPNILKYYYQTASPNDCFVADMSGMGQIHAPVFGEAFQNKQQIVDYYLQSTDGYMRLLGIDTLWVDTMDDATQQAYVTELKNLNTLLYGTNAAGEYLTRTSYSVGGKPVLCAFRSVPASRQVLTNLSAELAGRNEKFIFIGLDETKFAPEEDVAGAVAQAARSLGPEYVVVRPDQLGALFKSAVAAGLVPDGKPTLVATEASQQRITIPRVAAQAIEVDGNLGEWDALSVAELALDSASQVVEGLQYRRGLSDLSATARVAYDDKYLYLAARVRDDTVYVDDYNYAAGDCIELCLDTRSAPFREPVPTEGFYKLCLAPAAGLVGEPKLILLYPTFDVGLVSMNRHGIEEILASKLIEGGYVIEAAIPLQNFPRADFRSGHSIAFGLAVNDLDKGGTVESRIQWQAGNSRENALDLAVAKLS